MTGKSVYVETTASGKVRYKMPYVDPLTGKSRRVSVQMDKDTPRNRHKAEDLLILKINQICGGGCDADILLADAVALYYSEKARIVKPSTLTAQKSRTRALFNYFPQGTKLQAITIVKWKEALQSAAKTPKSYNELCNMVKTFLKWAYENDLIDNDSIRRKLAPVPVEKADKVTYLEEHEIKPFLRELSKYPGADLLAEFLLLTGLRIGEALALTMDDIQENCVVVSKTYNYNLRQAQTAKTDTSRREVSIQPQLADCIRRIKIYRRSVMQAFGFLSNLVFFDDKGRTLCTTNVNARFASAGQRALKRRIKPHELRHTHASMLLAAGVPIDVISRRLGHSNITVTQKVYLHITEKLKDADAAAVRNVKIII